MFSLCTSICVVQFVEASFFEKWIIKKPTSRQAVIVSAIGLAILSIYAFKRKSSFFFKRLSPSDQASKQLKISVEQLHRVLNCNKQFQNISPYSTQKLVQYYQMQKAWMMEPLDTYIDMFATDSRSKDKGTEVLVNELVCKGLLSGATQFKQKFGVLPLHQLPKNQDATAALQKLYDQHKQKILGA